MSRAARIILRPQPSHITESLPMAKAGAPASQDRSAKMAALLGLVMAAALLLGGCGEPPWNNPYPEHQAG
ncbi:MAG: hypothetical protein PVJ30_06000, partial [Thiohalocapsa sp.]